MRILILSQYFWPENFRVNDLVTCLRERGHELRVLTGLPNYPDGVFFRGYGLFKKWRDQYEGVRVDRVPLWPRGRGRTVSLILNYFSFVVSATLFGLVRVRGQYACTFVFAPSPILQCIPAIIFKKFTGTPVLLWVQDLWPESVSAVGAIRRPSLLRLIEGMVRWIYRNCDLILVQSEAFRPKIEKLGGDASRICYLPNWTEDFYKPQEQYQGQKQRQGQVTGQVEGIEETLPLGFKVMFAGNLGKAQSLETIIEAAKRLRHKSDIFWIIVGDGRDRENFEATVRKENLGERIVFWGRKPAETMPRYFALADALLVTLRAEPIFSYTIPSKVQSYMACGRPIVAALNGEGARIIEESGAGLVGPAEDAETLAQNVLKLYDMSVTEREMTGRRGVEYYRRCFDRRILVDKLELWIGNLQQDGVSQNQFSKVRR